MRKAKTNATSVLSRLAEKEADYSSQNPQKRRREKGVTFTPQRIVDLMLDLLEATSTADNQVIIDTGAGLGRFSIGAAERFRNSHIIAVELDQSLALGMRGLIEDFGFTKRVSVIEGDFLNIAFPSGKPRVFLGNPPYVRHHSLTPAQKAWLRIVADRLGKKLSGLSGLHAYFLARILSEATEKDRLLMILPSEWIEASYGAAVKAAILERARAVRLYLFPAEAQVFEGTMTTSVILDMEFGGATREFQAGFIDPNGSLTPSGLSEVELPDREPECANWLTLARGALNLSDSPVKNEEQTIELGDLFDVHRGQVTGMNSVWIATDSTARLIPERFLIPCITDAKEILSAADGVLRSTRDLRQVIDLPKDLEALGQEEKEMIEVFLELAKRAGADKTYIGRHRRPWWRVGLHHPPVIVMSYMARRPPRFALNPGGARLLNIAHGLYPKETLTPEELESVVSWLNNQPPQGIGRTYAGGLIKVEPRDALRIRIPDPRLSKLPLAA